jgi:hypothetical protein
MTTIFKIVHPNGSSAEVRAPSERIALDCLIRNTQDWDWEFSQVTALRSYEDRHNRGEVEILGLNEAQIPTTSWFQSTKQEAVPV